MDKKKDKGWEWVVDKFGNEYIIIPGKGSDIMWSCHTDTVHTEGGRQLIRIKKGMAKLDEKAKANCLGADDGAGIWLMLEMIEAEKPGMYVFHRCEEKGGQGSDYATMNHGWWVKDKLGVKACIALDRKGYADVITHQGGTRCCSDEFAKSLVTALDMDWFKPCSHGVFTDSANWTDHIGECTNLSVGYFAQHCSSESLDVSFLCYMRNKLIALDPEKLVFKRQPGDKDPDERHYYYGGWGGDDYGYGWKGTNNYGGHFSGDANKPKQGELLKDTTKNPVKSYYPDDGDDVFIMSNDERAAFRQMMREYPEEVMDYLEQEGLDMDDLISTMFERTGKVFT